MSAGAFKNIFLSLNFTTKHTRQRLFALVIHSVMCRFLQCVGQVRNVCEGKNANSTNMGVCDSLYVGVCGWPPCRGALDCGAKYGT